MPGLHPVLGLQSELLPPPSAERLQLVQEGLDMPRFRVEATIVCAKPLARLIPIKLRKEARRLSKMGLQIDLADVKVEEL